MATYLITGAAGFIGSRVTEFLLRDGHTVIGIDNLNDAYDVRLKEWRLDQIKDHPGFSFYKLDVCDRLGLHELLTQLATHNSLPSAIINLAARAGVRQSVENPWVYIETNTTGTLNLLELARQFGIHKFVLASTSSLYGQENPMPYKEDQNTDNPLSPYAASKKAAEALCHTFHYLYGIDVTVFRYFTVYGPAGRPDMMPFRMVQWIDEERPVAVFGDGKQSRDFTYIDDIARGTIMGLKSLGHEIINLGSDKPIVLMNAIRMVENKVGKDANLEFKPRHIADVTTTWADIGKAERLLGWQPEIDFEQGLSRLIEWYGINKEWASQIVTD